MTTSKDNNTTGDDNTIRASVDFNASTVELAECFQVLPSAADSKEYLKLRMMQLTELASRLLCIDQGNLKLMDFLQKQIPATYRLISEDAPTVAASEATEALGVSFSFEDTNYKPVAVDASGQPLSETEREDLGL